MIGWTKRVRPSAKITVVWHNVSTLETSTAPEWTCPELRCPSTYTPSAIGTISQGPPYTLICCVVVVQADEAPTYFSVLQTELKGKSTKIVIVAFDLLSLTGRDLRGLPLYERKAVLKKTIADTDVQFSESFEIEGREMYKQACKVG